MAQYTTQLPLAVSDEEVANAIKDDKNIFPDGKFDLITYREKFLPFYRTSYGENFEEVIRKQLVIEKMGVLMDQLYGSWNQELQKSLDPINKAHAETPKKTGKTAKAETPETVPHTISSIDPSALFTLWLDRYRDQVKTENYLQR